VPGGTAGQSQPAGVRASWALWRTVPNEHPYQGDYRTGSFADFYIFAPVPTAVRR
jgi:hypothetical protein